MKGLRYYTQWGKFFGKSAFYVRHFAAYMVPRCWWRRHRWQGSKDWDEATWQHIRERAEYYNHMSPTQAGTDWTRVGDYRYPFGQKKKFSCYFFDLYEHLKYFGPDLRVRYLFGDIIEVETEPTIVKSRPIRGDNGNSVVINLDKLRHFKFLKDTIPFEAKKDLIISRNFVTQPHRKRFIEMYLDHPMCDVGQINPSTEHPEWVKPFVLLQEQLSYKFICCVEGNDVATNLKWVMSSNSLAVMPRPTYETWFMEGTLIPNYHYVEIKADFSDLPERMQYYIDHPDEARAIIDHAHEYIRQFQDPRIEQAVAHEVLTRYFTLSGQQP